MPHRRIHRRPVRREYSGPAILSRGETPAAQTAAPIAFRPYIGLSGSLRYRLVAGRGNLDRQDTLHGSLWRGVEPGRVYLSRLEAHHAGAGLPGGFPALLYTLLGRHRSIPVADPHPPAQQARDLHAARTRPVSMTPITTTLLSPSGRPGSELSATCRKTTSTITGSYSRAFPPI